MANGVDAAKLAAAPATVATDGGSKGDNSLPDPTRRARIWLFVLAAVGVVAAVVINEQGWTATAFDPSKAKAADLALFAGFYVGALVIERTAELVTPLVPWWTPPGADDAAKAAHVKADRAVVMLGLTFVAGTILSALLGLFFLKAIGMQVSHTVDVIVTGLAIAAGTKPLHDFITLLQNRDTPKTNTTVNQ